MGETLSITPSVTPVVGIVNFDHGSETVRYYNNTASELAAGTPIIQGDLFGVPVRPIPAYTMGALMIEGAMVFPKSITDAGLTVGADAYWDNTNLIATSNGIGNKWIGKVEFGLGANGVPGAVATADAFVYIQVESVAAPSGDDPNIIVGGVAQDIFTASATQNYAIGAKRDLPDGRRFRYSANGAGAITRALMQQAAAPNTSFIDITQTGHAQVVGATAITVLCTTGSALAAGYFNGGKMIVTTGTNLGDIYDIVSSVLEATDTLLDLVLAQPLRHAIAATDKVTLIPNRNQATIVVPATTATGPAAGVPLVDVAASNYYWAQTKGPAPLIVDTGDTLVVGGKAGIPATDAIAGTCGTATATAYAFPVYGTVLWIGAAAEPALINLELE